MQDIKTVEVICGDCLEAVRVPKGKMAYKAMKAHAKKAGHN